MKKYLINGLGLLVTTFLLSGSANAVTIVPNLLVNEVYDPPTGTGYFNVSNSALSEGMYAFAVANDYVTYSYSTRPNWYTTIVQKTDWDSSGWEAVTGPGSTPVGWTFPVVGSNSWDGYFGASTNQAVFYVTGVSTSVGLESGEAVYADDHLAPGASSINEFRFSTMQPASPFVAWTQDGSVLAQGNTLETVVPVPAAVWLLGSGLLGLIGVARRNLKAG